MKAKQILFPEVNTAALVDRELPDEPGSDQVLVKTIYSTVSPGTERANITGSDSVAGSSAPSVSFPRALGYSSCGVVEKVGCDVRSVVPGDRVIVFWGKHSEYNLISEYNVVKIADGISDAEAAAIFICTFPMAAVRKTGLELGESAMVMGLGTLGQFAVRLLAAAGAAPVIAADPVEKRRLSALEGGADYALDPLEKGFARKVKELTGGGVNAAIEVTGVGAGLDETLDCMAKMGRVALLGCTRDKNFTIDYYRKVHSPGITLIGAHTNARPMEESYPGHFTHRDDINAIMWLIKCGRLDIKKMLGPVYAPQECEKVYERLINDREFPMLCQFDWRRL